LLTEIDKLETALMEASAEETDKAMITARLEIILARWRELDRPDGEDIAEKINSASASEIFDFIDQDLGRI
jgi:hypothetical protein